MREACEIGLAGPVDLQLLTPYLDGVGPATPGYAAPVIAQIAIELLRRGHELSVFTTSPDDRDWGTYSGRNLRLYVLPVRQRARDRALNAFRVERQALERAVRASACSIVHAHWTYEFALAAIASGRPALVTVHDWAPQVLRYQRHPYRVVRLGMQAAVLRRARFLTANSPYIAEKVSKVYGKPIDLIPNGFSFAGQIPQRQVTDVFNVGALNNGFGRRKNVQSLLRAHVLVRRALPSAVLRLAGADFGPGESAERWARHNGVADSVEFLGRLCAADVPAFMAGLDLFVHPSLEESFGMVLLEALDAGTPVIAGRDSGAVPWVLGGGAAGSLVDVRSPDAIAAEIVRLGSDEAARRSSAETGREYVRQQFSLEHVVDLYEAAYRRVLRGES